MVKPGFVPRSVWLHNVCSLSCVDPFTDCSVLLWALIGSWKHSLGVEEDFVLLSLQGSFSGQSCLWAPLCLLPVLPQDPACLCLLCGCAPTLVLLGLLPLAWLGRLIQFQLPSPHLCPIKQGYRPSSILGFSVTPCRCRIGKQSSRGRYKQRWDNSPYSLGVGSCSELLFLLISSTRWVGEAQLAAFPSGPPFLRSRKASFSRNLPLCSLRTWLWSGRMVDVFPPLRSSSKLQPPI